jgi:hypothetical protein
LVAFTGHIIVVKFYAWEAAEAEDVTERLVEVKWGRETVRVLSKDALEPSIRTHLWTQSEEEEGSEGVEFRVFRGRGVARVAVEDKDRVWELGEAGDEAREEEVERREERSTARKPGQGECGKGTVLLVELGCKINQHLHPAHSRHVLKFRRQTLNSTVQRGVVLIPGIKPFFNPET